MQRPEKMYRQPQKRRNRSPLNTRQARRNIAMSLDLFSKTNHYAVIEILSNIEKGITDPKKEITKELENLETAKYLLRAYRLPRWKELPRPLKHLMKIAAAGESMHTHTVTVNFGSKVAANTEKASRGSADYIGRKLRNILGSDAHIAITIERARNRCGQNPELHLHGVIDANEEDLTKLEMILKKVFSEGYVEVAKNKAAHLSIIERAGGWAGYCCKEFESNNEAIEAYASNKSSREGKDLYNQFREWSLKLNAIPSPVPEEPPKPDKKPDPELEIIKAINEHRERFDRRKKHKYH